MTGRATVVLDFRAPDQLTLTVARDHAELVATDVWFRCPLSAQELQDVRWYLEYRTSERDDPEADRAARMRARLPELGARLFAAVFDGETAETARDEVADAELEFLVRSSDETVLGLPWELLRESVSKPPVATGGGVVRSLPDGGSTLSAQTVRHDRLRVLLVIARPSGVHDVSYRSIGTPLLASVRGCAEVVVLRPPTLDALAAHLADARATGNPYTVVHFDVHGELAEQGTIVLERQRGGAHRVPATRVARVLADTGVAVVVLNACESGAVARAIDTAVATRLVAEGVPAVVAMGYRMLVDAAAEFTSAFYGHLVRGGDVTGAVGAARARLHASGSAQWPVPVYYRRHENRFVGTWRPPPSAPAAPDRETPVGRDDTILALERAARRDRIVLLHGMAGIGKTTVARMFAEWWSHTSGNAPGIQVVWTCFASGPKGFDDLMGVLGTALASAPHADAVVAALAERRVLLVWDGFDAVRTVPDLRREAAWARDDHDRLSAFVARVAAGDRSTILLTSRSGEFWLEPPRRVQLAGLDAVEVRQLVDRLGATLDEHGPDGDAVVLRLLGGHPHALREVVPLVADVERWQLLDTLRGDTDSFQFTLPAELMASIESSLRQLSPEVLDKLVAVRLLSGVVDVAALLWLSDPQRGLRFAGMDAAAWRAVLDCAVDVGLLQQQGTNKYVKHPALSARLARLWFDQDPGGDERYAALMALAARERNPAARMLMESGAINGHARTDDLAAMAGMGVVAQSLRTIHVWTGAGVVLRPLWTFVDRVVPELEIRLLVTKLLARWRRDQVDLPGQLAPLDQDGMIWLTLPQLMDLPLPDLADALEQVLDNVRRMRPAPVRARRMVAALQRLAEVNKGLGRWGDAWDNASSMLRLADDVDSWSHAEAVYPVPELLMPYLCAGEQQDSQATALGLLSEVGVLLDRHDEAVECSEREIAIRESMDDSSGLGDALRARGDIEKDRGDYAAARRWYTRALTRYADHHNRFKESATYSDLGSLAMLEIRLGDAEQWFRRARVLPEQRDDASQLATNDVHLGDLARLRGRLNDAEGWYHAAIERLDALGEDSQSTATTVALAWRGLGAVASDRGDLRSATTWYHRARKLFAMLGEQKLVRHCDKELSRIARFGG